LGIGDWFWGIGDWGLGPIPNPQSPIPNPQSPIFLLSIYFIKLTIKLNLIILFLSIFLYRFLEATTRTILEIFTSFNNCPNPTKYKGKSKKLDNSMNNKLSSPITTISIFPIRYSRNDCSNSR